MGNCVCGRMIKAKHTQDNHATPHHSTPLQATSAPLHINFLWAINHRKSNNNYHPIDGWLVPPCCLNTIKILLLRFYSYLSISFDQLGGHEDMTLQKYNFLSPRTVLTFNFS